ncbi:MAG: glycosyltransferase, partial [Bacteroidia bacterium]|nr:glycosyltransferase [Bacteroidia bacterium]
TVLIQHEFGLFDREGTEFQKLLEAITKPVIVVFHTVLPNPDQVFRKKVIDIASSCESLIVMTNNSSKILQSDYNIDGNKINVIPHGTHLVKHLDKIKLKKKYNLENKKVLSTFGLLSSGKSIETSLNALPSIVAENSDVKFLIMGKTHPGVVKHEGEKYREMLIAKVKDLGLEENVEFINKYLSLDELLEYLQLTDVYLFTSKDPNQAVSGTFAYAMSCGCPIVSTPIPHALEVLEDAGIIFDFGNSEKLTVAVNKLLGDDDLRTNIKLNGLHKMAATSWENTAEAHALIFQKSAKNNFPLWYRIPEINISHIQRLTTDFGMVQFSKLNRPDLSSGYTLDDNARALVAISDYYAETKDEKSLPLMDIYLEFIKYCMQPEGNFVNYVNIESHYTMQNTEVNLEDSNGRAIWALGHVISLGDKLPKSLVDDAESMIRKTTGHAYTLHSTRAMAFALKGYCGWHSELFSSEAKVMIRTFANRLLQMYRHEAEEGWQWFESYMTYGNAVLSEAMLSAYVQTGNTDYMNAADTSFNFLLSHTMKDDGITAISNRSWHFKGQKPERFGEQPIDIAYTILALAKFYDVTGDIDYLDKLRTAFYWFLGKNHLGQIIYNPSTGGCYDGLEETHVNLNQGAESTESYLMARMTTEKYLLSNSTKEKEGKTFYKEEDQVALPS